MSRISIILGVLLSVTLILAVWISTTTAQEIENLLTNPDFEADTGNWTIGAGATFIIDKKEKFPVGQVAKAQIDNPGANNWEPEIHSPTVNLMNNKKYTYSFWAKTEPGKTKSISSCFEQNNPVWAGAGAINITLTDQWVEYTATGVWATATPSVVIHIALNYPPTHLLDVWFAHFRVYEGDYVKDKIDLEMKPKAVTPGEKLASSWGEIKSR